VAGVVDDGDVGVGECLYQVVDGIRGPGVLGAVDEKCRHGEEGAGVEQRCGVPGPGLGVDGGVALLVDRPGGVGVDRCELDGSVSIGEVRRPAQGPPLDLLGRCSILEGFECAAAIELFGRQPFDRSCGVGGMPTAAKAGP
jgi:hypothetical protein